MSRDSGVYANGLQNHIQTDNLTLIFLTTVSAITGAYIGNKLLKKVTLKSVQTTVAILLNSSQLVWVWVGCEYHNFQYAWGNNHLPHKR